MFNIGFTELLVIGAIALLVMGPEKLPHFFRTLAKWSVKARRTVNDLKSTMEEEAKNVAGPEIDELKQMHSSLRRSSSSFGGRIGADNLSDFLEKGANMLEHGSHKTTEQDGMNPPEKILSDTGFANPVEVGEEFDVTPTEYKLDSNTAVDSNAKPKTDRSDN